MAVDSLIQASWTLLIVRFPKTKVVLVAMDVVDGPAVMVDQAVMELASTTWAV